MKQEPKSAEIAQRVRDHYDSMSKSQQKVAEFFITNEEAVYLSAAKIAELLHVSHSTVVRTAQAIGYEGFPDLQAALQEQMFGRTSSAAAYELGGRKLTGENNPPSAPAVVLRRTMLRDARDIEQLIEAIPIQDFEQAVAHFIQARTVYVMGVRSSAPMAMSFGLSLRQLRPNCLVLQPGMGDLADQIATITPDDLLFTICFGRYAEITLRSMDFAREHGATVITITDTPLSPAARRAHLSFVVAQGVWFYGASAALLSLLNAFISAILSVQRPNAEARVEAIDSAIKYFGVFDSGDQAPPMRDEDDTP
ncbi:MAG: MurR/RpiR family transcriptional regulator [Anaerolineae bacterium]